MKPYERILLRQVEPDESASVTAEREVLEEAGVIGTLGRCLGVFEVCILKL